VGFDFDRAILNLANQARVEMAARAIMSSPVKRVIVSGRAGQSRLSDGTVMTEVPGIAPKRIAAVGNALIAIGVRPDKVEMRQARIAGSTDPIQGVESRDVAIEVVLAPSRTCRSGCR
jgi:outer membrane protein OmpA-like peptidoglycan-associated protein